MDLEQEILLFIFEKQEEINLLLSELQKVQYEINEAQKLLAEIYIQEKKK